MRLTYESLMTKRRIKKLVMLIYCQYNNQYLGELHMAGGAKSRTSQAKDMGSQGGKAGGPARAQKLTQAQRSEIARKGANAKNNKSKGK